MTDIRRVTRSKEDAQASYDRLSRFYDWLTGDSERIYKQIGLRLLDLQSGEHVLEIGFGTGKTLVELARLVGSSGRVFGLDISEGMRAVAGRRLRKARLLERVELRCGDAAKLPYLPNSMDAVFMSFTLELFDTPEIPLVLAECQRVLKPGGRIGVVAMSAGGKAGLMTRLYGWANRQWPAIVDCRPIRARNSLESAGFIIKEARLMKMWGLPVEIMIGEVANG
jgi:ubiquinone/menaquinone biosynthesis C-methylase UbiE